MKVVGDLGRVIDMISERAGSKGFRGASHQVLRGVSRRNKVLREILGLVLAVLGDTGAVAVIIFAGRGGTARVAGTERGLGKHHVGDLWSVGQSHRE
jgi:hypothetical protein